MSIQRSTVAVIETDDPQLKDNRKEEWHGVCRILRDLRGLRLETLTEVRVASAKLGDIGLDALATSLKSLITLDVSKNELTKLPRELWSAPCLKTVIASENRISKLSKRVGRLVSLETLRLDGNLLRTLPLDAILSLPRVQVVSVYANLIETEQFGRERVTYAQWVCAGLALQRVPNRIAAVVPGKLFIGGVESTSDKSELRRIGVTHVLSVGASPIDVKETDGFVTMRLSIVDWPSEDLRPHFDAVCDFIDQGTRDDSHGCLVHCLAGQSRSVAFVMAWLIKRKGMGFDEAFALVKRSRFCACPNLGFQQQLKEISSPDRR